MESLLFQSVAEYRFKVGELALTPIPTLALA